MSWPKWRQIEDGGFDTKAAVRDLLDHGRWSDGSRMTMERIAEVVGYGDKSSIRDILDGHEPKHRRGEKLYILYFETFDRKPPLKVGYSPALATT